MGDPPPRRSQREGVQSIYKRSAADAAVPIDLRPTTPPVTAVYRRDGDSSSEDEISPNPSDEELDKEKDDKNKEICAVSLQKILTEKMWEKLVLEAQKNPDLPPIDPAGALRLSAWIDSLRLFGQPLYAYQKQPILVAVAQSLDVVVAVAPGKGKSCIVELLPFARDVYKSV
jgi:hypothetical protein